MKVETKKHPRRRFGARVWKVVRYFFRYLAIIIGLILWPIVRRVIRPKVVFVVYGTDSDQRAYWPRWVHMFIPSILPIGLLKFGGKTIGLIVASKLTLERFEEDPNRAIQVMEKARKSLPRARAIALAGRLPSWIGKAGGTIKPPFVEGHTGTCYAMTMSLLRAAEIRNITPKHVRLGLLGGAGFVGSRLAETASHHFCSVVALDPRYNDHEVTGNIYKTNEPSKLEHVDIAMVLTGKGDDIAGSLPSFKSGSFVVDDTHPPISRDLRDQMRRRGVILRKAVVGTPGFSMVPRLPNFRSWNIPGCLLEALVVGFNGWDALRDQHRFVNAAKSFGFRAELIEHPED